MRWLDSLTNSVVVNLSKLREVVKGQGSLMRLKSVRHSLATAARIKELLLIKWQKDLSVKEKICV